MVLITHILIAISSVGFTTYLYFKPTDNRLKASYGLVAATLISGTYLILSTGANMIQSCVSGLAYVAAVSVGIMLSQRKLAKIRRRIDE